METNESELISKQCIENAKHLLNASELLVNNGYENIAYHLSLAALEEAGKSSMVTSANIFKIINSNRYKKIIEDESQEHIRKLLWAIWLPVFCSDNAQWLDLGLFREIASGLHFKRLQGLYVNPSQLSIAPKEAIMKENVESLIKMTKERIGIEESHFQLKFTDEAKENFEWFLKACDDDLTKNYIFSNLSMTKLQELRNSNEWIKWLKEEIAKAERESKELLEKELSRNISYNSEEDYKSKWKIKFKLYSPSHSIRQKILNEFNENPRNFFLKLNKGETNDKRIHRLDVELSLPKTAHITRLWQVAWNASKGFAMGLNIATGGYFWWELPEKSSRVFEIYDLESNKEIGFDFREDLSSLNWGNNKLSLNDLTRFACCMPILYRKQHDHYLKDYLDGLSLLGKSNIHIHLEESVFMHFFNALVSAMTAFNDLNQNSSLAEEVEKIFTELLPDIREPIPKQYVTIANDKNLTGKFSKKITLEDCVVMKKLFDIYFSDRVLRNLEGENKVQAEQKV